MTELMARPLLNLHWPHLAGFVQPLAGEYAGRRTLLERVPFMSGYGVEIAMLVDVFELAGLSAMARSTSAAGGTGTAPMPRWARWPPESTSPCCRGSSATARA